MSLTLSAARTRIQPRQQVLHLLRAAVFDDALQEPLADAFRLLWALPQNVLEQQGVVLVDGTPTVGKCGDAQHGSRFYKAAICE